MRPSRPGPFLPATNCRGGRVPPPAGAAPVPDSPFTSGGRKKSVFLPTCQLLRLKLLHKIILHSRTLFWILGLAVKNPSLSIACQISEFRFLWLAVMKYSMSNACQGITCQILEWFTLFRPLG